MHPSMAVLALSGAGCVAEVGEDTPVFDEDAGADWLIVYVDADHYPPE